MIEATTQEAVDGLERVRVASDELERQRLLAVAAARRAGVSWEQIGRTLRLARQSAWERYGSLVEAIESGWTDATLTEDEAMALSRQAIAEVRRGRRARTSSPR